MLRVHNTLTKKKENFTPLEPGKVRFYHCGPTVYWIQHIGNMRAMVMADLIRRSLTFLDFKVSFVRNYTDVGHLTGDNLGDADFGEDRMEKAVSREQNTAQKIADKYIDQFEADTNALNVLPPDSAPRATDYIEQIKTMVQTLIDKGYAYVTHKAVYFDISKAKNYTALSKQDPERLLHGAGTGTVSDSNKRHPGDFSLWFFKTGLHQFASQTWPSPFERRAVVDHMGEGFPGWHIECSAMSKKLLGETLDIHMGGIEHIPIHHTNEIAQSEAANGKPFVHYWIHNEHLLIDGKKMSKSEGNVSFLKDIIEKGYDPLVLRYFFLQAHYRSQQNFTWDALDASRTALLKLKDRSKDLGDVLGKPNKSYVEKFKEALSDDFNIPEALALTWDMLKSKKLAGGDTKATLLLFDQVFGLKLDEEKKEDIPEEVQELVEKREQARKDKDWEESDRLRNTIHDVGFTIKDTDTGPTLHTNK